MKEIIATEIGVSYSKAIREGTDFLALNGQIVQEIGRIRDVNKALEKERKRLSKDTLLTEEQRNAELRNVTQNIAKNQSELKRLSATQRDFNKAIKATDKELSVYDRSVNKLSLLKKELKEISIEGRKAPEALVKEFKQLDDEIRKAEQSVGEFQRNVGNYRDGLKGIGGELASAFSLDGVVDLVQGGLNPLALGGAIATGVIAITDRVKELTAEFAKFRSETEQITGQTGNALDDTATRIQAIANTFDQDFNEVLLSSNALSKQLGIDFTESLDFIEQGFLGGVNANGEFLDSVKEYPAFIKEAELSTDEFLNILALSTQQGIFSDKGIDTVKEATLRLRELPTATQEALQGIGISLEEVERTINDEGIGGAIKLVSQRLGELEADSPQVGAAIADIFGSAGEDAGLQYLISLQNIGAETETLINTSTEFAQQQQRTLEVQNRFTDVQNELTKSLGDFGQGFENVGTEIETRFLTYLIEFINLGVEIKDEVIAPLIDVFFDLAEAFGIVRTDSDFFLDTIKFLAAGVKIAIIPIELLVDVIQFLSDKFVQAIKPITDFRNSVLDSIGGIGGAIDQLKAYVGIIEKTNEVTTDNGKTLVENTALINTLKGSVTTYTNELVKETKEKAKSATESKKRTTQIKEEVTGLSALQKQLSEAKKELQNAEGGNAIKEKVESIIALESQIEKFKGDIQQIRNELSNPLFGQDAQAIEPVTTENEVITTQNLDNLSNEATLLNEQALQDGLKEIRLNALNELDEATRQVRIRQNEELEAQIAEEQGLIQERNEAFIQSAAAAGNILGDVISDTESTLEDFNRALIQSALEALRQQLIVAAGQAIAKIFAANPIAGLAATAFVTPVLDGVFNRIASQLTFHTGGEVKRNGNKGNRVSDSSLKPDETNAKLQFGEAVLTRKAMQSNKEITIKGTPKQIASKLNSDIGKGVSFAKGASYVTPTIQYIPVAPTMPTFKLNGELYRNENNTFNAMLDSNSIEGIKQAIREGTAEAIKQPKPNQFLNLHNSRKKW